jgi:hypothetical protein
MESSSRSRSLRSVAVVLLLTLLVLIGLNHLVGRAKADPSLEYHSLPSSAQGQDMTAEPGFQRQDD